MNLWWAALAAGVLANTETYLLQIPYYYEIPPHPAAWEHTQPVQLNDTVSVLDSHPIVSAADYTLDTLLVSIPFAFDKEPKRLYVRLNNFGNAALRPSDLVNVKLCWPATVPVNFALSHTYLKRSQLTKNPVSNDAFLHLYVVVDMQADFYAIRPIDEARLAFYLAVSTLPSRVPIPIELYDFILYAVDLLILAAAARPYVLGAFKKTIFGARLKLA